MFQPFHFTRWVHGATLVSEPDNIPDDALRRATNVRLDRTLGVIEVRPGWTLRSTAGAFAGSVSFLSRLFVSTVTYGFVQIGTDLRRTNNTWGGSTSIATPGTALVSDANEPDGNGNLLKYLVNGTIRIKDTGAVVTNMGIQPPTAAPTTAALATDLFTQIGFDDPDDAVNWTGTNLSVAPANDTTFFIEGVDSVSFSIAASTFGSIARFLGAAVNLDTLTGGDALVKNDDYIHLWVRVDRPERVTFLQIDVDIDADSTGVGDSFRQNYYSVRLGSVEILSQGINQWNQVQIRKASFARYGADTSRSWANARGFRIAFLTNSGGTVQFWTDDFKMRGGVGIEGDIQYTVCYRNSITAGRGNPPKDADSVVQFTTALRTNRQRINLTTTNVRESGANHPGDTQIDQIMIWRKGGTFETAVHVATILDTAASPYLDNTSDATLVLRERRLETDNDIPPTGTTRILFGPSAAGHLFMIVDGYRLYFSKPYERLENRAENWGANNFALIGDGSAVAVAGIASAAQIRVWTRERTFKVVGIGEDTFLPVAMEGTRGCVGQAAVASGDGVLFFVSQDGIYMDVEGRQTKLTGAIDRFFQGLTVDGQVGWNPTSTFTALARLAFLHEATGSALVLLYVESGATALNRFLTLKPNVQNGLLTECFFGTSALTTLQSLYQDSINRELLAGGADGNVYRIEDPAEYADNATAITFTARTKSYDFGQPQRRKFIAHGTAEGMTTSQNVTMTAYYDRNQTTEVLGTVNTQSETDIELLASQFPDTRRRDIALELTGSVTSRIAITRLGCFFEPQPELLTYLDSGILSFDFIRQLKRFEIDINLPSQATLTVYANGVQVFRGNFLPTSARQNAPYPLPPGLRGREWRVTLLTAGDPFLCYKWAGFFKMLGTDQQYQEQIIVQGV